MPATLVQWAQASAATVTLGATPTVGNLLVAARYRRSAAATALSGFTDIVASTLNLGNAGVWIGNRVVQSGDTAGPFASQASARLIVMEWSGIMACDAVSTGGAPNTNVLVVNPDGSGQAIGGYFVHTDQSGRQVHVVSPSTVLYDAFWGGADEGPQGSVGYGTGADFDKMSVQATQGAIDFEVDTYWIGNFPLKPGPSQGVIIAAERYIDRVRRYFWRSRWTVRPSGVPALMLTNQALPLPHASVVVPV